MPNEEKLPDGSLDVLLQEKQAVHSEIQERLKTGFSHFGYAGAVLAFAIPMAIQATEWWMSALAFGFAIVAILALIWVALLNMRWVQHLGAYQRIVERRLAGHFGTPITAWEHYAQSAAARSWLHIPRAPDTCHEAPISAPWPTARLVAESQLRVPSLRAARSLVGLTALLGVVMLLLASCVGLPSSNKLPPSAQASRKLAVFFDGTANDETSDTNVKKLHSLVTLQARPDISTFYVEGVGAGSKLIGMATAWGAGYRVRMAYRYLLENHRAGDTIYLFGFSRGAYAARILASMLYYAGLPSVDLKNDKEFVDDLYDAYKGPQADRRQRIQKLLAERGLGGPSSVRVKLMGLWDTVEAHGLPDYSESPDENNPLYGDQLCNVDRALHAVSLDDDRARIFTPILLTRPHLLDDCVELKPGWGTDFQARAKFLDDIVEEVWFAGAHTDVGGGYKDSSLSGVSLNWMLRGLRQEQLVPADHQVREDVFDTSHDPEGGLWGLIYRQQSRNLLSYARSSHTLYNGARLKVHGSALDRLLACKDQGEDSRCLHREHEFPWGVKSWDPACFTKTGEGRYAYVGANDAACFIVRNDD